MARLPRFFRFISHTLTLIFISYFLNQKILNPIIQKNIIRYLPDIKYLLIWSSLPGIKGSGQKHFLEKNCHAYNCYFTTNKSFFGDLRYFDGIIFNLQDVSKGKQKLPSVRNKLQKYIFAANDSADNFPVCDSVYDGFFNWTWTYKSDSTIPYRFITIFNLENEELGNRFRWTQMKPLMSDEMKRDLRSKSKTAAIFLDKCESRSKREVFLKNLQKHLLKYNMTVDVFGKCGTMECKRKTMKPCFWKLKKFYWFYLAFENSFATDFVTKTVIYAYKNNVVPIVYGKADYNRYLPPDSYLDGLALGEEKLALIMYQIITFDRHRYLQYFKWKNYYTVQESQILDACSLCSALNNPNWLTHQVTYSKFRKWWNEDYERRCAEPSSNTIVTYELLFPF